jgi:hypothetical protein
MLLLIPITILSIIAIIILAMMFCVLSDRR